VGVLAFLDGIPLLLDASSSSAESRSVIVFFVAVSARMR